MLPLLFPLLLILYGEFSRSCPTRRVSRMFLYSYLFSIFVPFFITYDNVQIVLSWTILSLTPLWLLCKENVSQVKPVCVLLLCLYAVNYISVLINDYTMFYLIPYYYEYSNLILREVTFLTVTLYNQERMKDWEINLIAAGLYLVEYSYIIGF